MPSVSRRAGRGNRPLDGPDEAGKLARHRGDDDGRLLAASGQGAIARGEATLRLPGDIANGSWRGRDLRQLRPADPRRMAVAPGALHQDAPRPAVAGLGDAGALDPITGGALARHQTEI